MAIFTALAVAGFLGIETGFFATAAAFVLNAAVGAAATLGLSYAAKALSGNKAAPSAVTDHFSAQGTLQAAGDVPRSFNLGYSVTAGSLVYANTWQSVAGATPNAYLTQVIALADLPGGDLLEMWVNGERVTLPLHAADAAGFASTDPGYNVPEYFKNGVPKMWVRYHNGTQTTADNFCTSLVANADRPYSSTRVGHGIAYVVVTSHVEDTLYTGFPTFKFAVSGIPLYDPSKDSTNGGSGSHRYSDPTTWGGDGDSLPAVQIYNILRGFYYGGAWLYGLQGMGSARLPGDQWAAQINKCRATLTGPSGSEATYRSGGQINVNAQPANAVEAFLTACQGRLSEIGGFYKIHLGAPDSSPSFGMTFSDDDILSSEPQVYRPFFALADSVNGIQATYPDPAQGWNSATAPAYYRTDLEAKDGNRRLMANPAFDFVPYAGQVQRLQKSAIEEAQRARTHTIVLPPAFWVGEPGDIAQWSSVRNGYASKLFRIDSVVDRANLDVALNITEVDPADYSWNQAADFTSVTTGSTVILRPDAQGVVDWFVEPYTLMTAGQPRRAAIRLSWDGSMASVSGVQYEVRLVEDSTVVTRGRTDQLAVGSIIVSQSLIPNTAYEARGQYIPSWPRDMLWSDWLPVTTPDVSVTLADFDAALQYNVQTLQDAFNDRLLEVEQKFATLQSSIGAQQWTDTQSVRSQLSSRSDAAFAEITRVDTVQTSATSALATSVDTVTARVEDVETGLVVAEADIVTNATAFATLDSAFASYTTTTTATLGSLSSSVTTNSSAIATLDGYAAAQYSVTLDVNGYASGFNLVNGGAGFSTFTIIADKFQIQLPGYNGSAPVPVFTTGTLSGSAAIGISANVFLDGTLTARAIAAGTITAVQIAANTITASQIATGTITSTSGAIGALSVNSVSIADAAVTVPQTQSLTSPPIFPGTTANVNSFTVSVDTAGLSGKTLTLFAAWTGTLTYGGTTALNANSTLKINGSAVANTQSIDRVGFASISGSITFTATGGVMSFPVSADIFLDTNVVLTNRTLFAMVAKR